MIDWRTLEAQLRPFVARRLDPADVDDVLQEVWLRMHRALHQLRGPELVGGWVRGIARSAIADHLRMRRRHPLPREDAAGAEAALEGGVDAPPSDDDDAPPHLLASALVPFVSALPRPYREALTLTELEGMTQAAAAELLGISLPAMKSRVLRGRERLRRMFEACCELALDARQRVIACEPRRFAEVTPDCCS